MARGSKASQKRSPSAHKTDGDGMELNSSGTGNTSARELLVPLFVFPPQLQVRYEQQQQCLDRADDSCEAHLYGSSFCKRSTTIRE